MARRQAILLLVTMGVALVATLTACGGESDTSGNDEPAERSGEPYDVRASMASLEEANWEVTEPEETPDTYMVVQTGYLETTAPDGEPIDLQFFESPEDAQGELAETRVQEAPFDGTTLGNVLVFDPEAETAAVSPENLEALQELLR